MTLPSVVHLILKEHLTLTSLAFEESHVILSRFDVENSSDGLLHHVSPPVGEEDVGVAKHIKEGLFGVGHVYFQGPKPQFGLAIDTHVTSSS